MSKIIYSIHTVPERWQQDILSNNKSTINQLFDREEAYEIVMFELFPNQKSCMGEANSFYGKAHTKYTKNLLSQLSNKYYKSLTQEQRNKIHGHKGKSNYWYGKSRSKELNPMYGKTHSEKTKRKSGMAISKAYWSKTEEEKNEIKNKLSESQSKRWTNELREERSKQYKELGIKPPSPKGLLWWNNGIEVKRSKVCPGNGWVRGRSIKVENEK